VSTAEFFNKVKYVKKVEPSVDEILQGGATKFQGDVPKLAVLFHAEISNDVRVLVGLAEEVDLAVGDAEAGRQDALDGDVAVVETAPEKNDTPVKDIKNVLVSHGEAKQTELRGTDLGSNTVVPKMSFFFFSNRYKYIYKVKAEQKRHKNRHI
jgi:hypothetical protein